MEFFRNRDREYLNRTKDAAESESDLSAEEYDQSAKEITDRLTESSWQSEGLMNFEFPGEKGSGSVVIDYDSVIDENLQSYLATFNNPDFLDDMPDKSKYRRIKEIIIEKGQDRLKLEDIYNGSLYIFLQNTENWSPKEKIQHSNGMVLKLKNGKDILEVRADPTTIHGLFVLLHEVGHVVDGSSSPEIEQKRNEVRKKLKNREKLKPAEQALIIRDERSADAFALKKMKRFFDKDGVEKVDKLCVRQGIKNYHDTFAGCVNPPDSL